MMIHHFGVSPQKKSVFRSVEEDKIKNTYFIYSNICTHFITPAGIFPLQSDQRLHNRATLLPGEF